MTKGKPYHYSLFFCWVLCILSPFTWALPEDRTKPIEIEADRAELDELQGYTSYTGNVIVTQGTMVIHCDEIKTFSNKDGLIKAIATGNPAHYQQVIEIDKPMTHAYAKTITYLAVERSIFLQDDAKLEQDGNTFTGKEIVYNIDSRTMNAKANKTGDNVSKDSTKDRVHMIIQPHSIEKERELNKSAKKDHK